MLLKVLSGCRWMSCCVCCLLLVTILTSSCTSLSVSSPALKLGSLHRRSVRSVAVVDNNDDADDRNDKECSSDFVEKFFRVLSGPACREAVLASVANLLSEDERFDWRAATERSAPSRVSSSSSSRQILPSGRHSEFLQNFPRFDAKRLAPKFNPSGWRRKRDVTSSEPLLRRTLIGLLSQHPQPSTFDRNRLSSLFSDDDVSLVPVPETAEWQSFKRNVGVGEEQGLTRRVGDLELKLKRRPLEFNPTGWWGPTHYRTRKIPVYVN